MDTFISDNNQFGFYGKTNGCLPKVKNENKRQLKTASIDKRVLEMGCKGCYGDVGSLKEVQYRGS
jgi:hypothetical protein